MSDRLARIVRYLGLFMSIAFPLWGFALQDPTVSRALAEGHTGRVLIFTIILVFLAWQTEIAYHTLTIRRTVIWTVLMCTLAGMLCGSPWWDKRVGADDREMLTACILFGTILVLAIMAAFSPHKDEATASDHLLHWGQLASLGIMLLALFAFCIKVDGNGHLKILWQEVPAILIVFVLAELGVALVVKADKTERGVTLAAEAANLASKSATAATESADKATSMAIDAAEGVITRADESTVTLNKAAEQLEKLNDAIGQLNDMRTEQDLVVKQIQPLTKELLWPMLTTQDFHRQLGLEEPQHFWTAVWTFIDRWAPERRNGDKPANPGTLMLVGELFRSFIGSAPANGQVPADGSVVPSYGAISCITADGVFAKASQQWLDSMSKYVEGRKLLIWTMTRLLPTEFAFPSVWWSKTDDNPMVSARVDALNDFVSSVIATCKSKDRPVQYRRFTVDLDPVSPDLICGVKKAELANSLDNWLIWDPRTGDHNGLSRYVTVREWSLQLLNELLTKLDGKPDNSYAYKDALTRKTLMQINGGMHVMNARTERSRLFPVIPSNSGGTEVYVFAAEFTDHTKPIDPAAADDQHSQTVDGGVIGASGAFLDATVTLQSFQSLDLPGQSRILLERHFEPGETLTRRGLLKHLGWTTLRDWYRINLHTETDISSGQPPTDAWWAEVRTDELKALKHLRIEWGRWEVDTLDLLMIGSEGAGKEDRVWYGAALSNLQLDRTECTVRLVTDPTHLKEIADFVEAREQMGGAWRTWAP